LKHRNIGVTKARSERFIELLKTVDGIFVQRYLAYPEEVWTWDEFDLFTLKNIDHLLGDEFLDGELPEQALTMTTAFAQLKKARKWFKWHAHAGTLEQALRNNPFRDAFCVQFEHLWQRVLAASGTRRVYLTGLLSQTRGCGTPPPLVVLQSKSKFLRTVSEEPSPVPAIAGKYRRALLGEILRELPDSSFTGLATKARVTVTSSACWENTRKQGGTSEEIRSILLPEDPFEQIPERDLQNGRIVGYFSVDDRPVGESIFWSCLDRTLRTQPDELTHAFLTVVKEPGKARSVTKARACLKIVLDLVSKICAEPLAKGIRSSQSGMTASNHGWNVFNHLTEDEMEDMCFDLESREETQYGGYVERTDHFVELYCSSTDYSEATDQLRHDVASDLANGWMLKCGIPPLLRGIVNRTCYYPRRIFFHANGAIEDIGHPTSGLGKNIRYVLLRKGVLMGDPLTKVVLHLVNVIVRRASTRLLEKSFYAQFPNGAQLFEAVSGVAEKSVAPDTSADPG
jgi:hypothetical protein